MSLPFVREFTLAGPKGDGRHAYVNKEGAFIGRGVPLLERDALGQWRPRGNGILERLFAKGYGISVELGWRATQLRDVAQALNKGDVARANFSLVRAELPPLPSTDLARAMARDDGLLVKYNPDWDDEPRVPEGDPAGGQWTTDGGAGDSSSGARPFRIADSGAVATDAPTLPAPPQKPWVDQPNPGFRDFIANRETPGADTLSDYGYGQINVSPSGVALGRYQITNTSLQDIGLKNADGTWRTDTFFYQQYGIKTDQDFLNNPRAQEDAMSAYLARTQELTADTLAANQGKAYTGISGQQIVITQAGIIAAAHRQGMPAVRNYLIGVQNGGTTDPSMSDQDKSVETRLRLGQSVPYTPIGWPQTIPNPRARR